MSINYSIGIVFTLMNEGCSILLKVPETLVRTTNYASTAITVGTSSKCHDEELDLCESLPNFLIPSSTTYK